MIHNSDWSNSSCEGPVMRCTDIMTCSECGGCSNECKKSNDRTEMHDDDKKGVEIDLGTRLRKRVNDAWLDIRCVYII